MKDELIALLSDFKYPVYLQGSLAADEPYPPTFFTFWVNTSQDYSHYDNQPIGYVWTFDVNFYSVDPSLVNTVPAQAIDLLRANGWIAGGRGWDLPSDDPTHTGFGFSAIKIQRKEEPTNGDP